MKKDGINGAADEMAAMVRPGDVVAADPRTRAFQDANYGVHLGRRGAMAAVD
jgi:hypothetical protein